MHKQTCQLYHIRFDQLPQTLIFWKSKFVISAVPLSQVYLFDVTKIIDFFKAAKSLKNFFWIQIFQKFFKGGHSS